MRELSLYLVANAQQGRLAMSGCNFIFMIGMEGGWMMLVPLASSWQRVGILLAIIQCAGQPDITENYVTPNVKNFKVENFTSQKIYSRMLTLNYSILSLQYLGELTSYSPSFGFFGRPKDEIRRVNAISQ